MKIPTFISKLIRNRGMRISEYKTPCYCVYLKEYVGDTIIYVPLRLFKRRSSAYRLCFEIVGEFSPFCPFSACYNFVNTMPFTYTEIIGG